MFSVTYYFRKFLQIAFSFDSNNFSGALRCKGYAYSGLKLISVPSVKRDVSVLSVKRDISVFRVKRDISVFSVIKSLRYPSR